MPELERRRKAVVVLLIVMTVVLVVAVVSDIFEMSLLDRMVRGEDVSTSEADASDTRQGLIGLFQFLVYAACVVLFLRWIHRAYTLLQPAERRWDTGWAIGAWFVPVLNLWRPKQIVNDLWNAGGSPAPAALLTAWWTAWLVSGWVGNIALRAIFRDDTVVQLRDAALAGAVADIAAFIASVLAILMIRAVTRRVAVAHRPVPPSMWTSPERPPGLVA